MSLKGLILACKYSWNCQTAEALGFQKKLFALACKKEISKEDEMKLEKVLQFFDPFRWYQKIALENQIKDPFDFKVVRFYWLGSPELKSQDWHNYTTFLRAPLKCLDLKLVLPCLVLPAKVEDPKEKDGFLIVTSWQLSQSANGLGLLPNKYFKIENPFNLKLKKGDYVTVHFGKACEKITPKEAQKLLEITWKSLEKISER